MKLICFVATLLACGTARLQAQPINTSQTTMPSPMAYRVVEQGANYNIWQREEYETAPNGSVVTRIRKYTELASGLNFLNANGQWQPSIDEIDILPDGTAAAASGQHQVHFPNDIDTEAIELKTPDGLILKSQPVGLSYDDGTNTVLIAILTNSVGQLISSNQVVYPNAFVGLNADLRYTYRKSGFEQDVILHEQPPSPASLGLNPETTKLQMLTEFYDPPQPQITPNASANQGVADENLNFGTMKMVPGRAFMMGAAENTAGNEIKVGKRWVTMAGRQILIEQVPIDALAPALVQLPVSTAKASLPSLLQVVSAKGRTGQPRLTHRRPMPIVKAGLPEQGLVLDYNTVNSSLTNYTFQSDTTYYASGSVYLYGTNTFEGGTIIKYASGGEISAGAGCWLNWEGSAYQPVVFTAKDDNSVGQPVSGSTGNPSGYYAQCALDLYGFTNSLACLRISYAKQGIIADNGSNSLYDGQLFDCQAGIECQSGNLNLRNVLFANVQTNLNGLSSATVDVQNATFNGGSNLVSAVSASALTLENCVLANLPTLTNGVAPSLFTGTNDGFYEATEFGVSPVTNTFYPFKAAGGGSYYLTNGCAFRSAGTSNLDDALAANLFTKTTWPPTIYTNVTFTSAQTFSPQAARDTNATPDLGYHYDPIDYAFGGCEAESNLTFTAGTAVGWFRTTSGWEDAGYGIYIANQQTVTFKGLVTDPCYWIRLCNVQEHDTTAGYGPGGLDGEDTGSISQSPVVQADFLKAYLLAYEDGNYFRDDYGFLVVRANNCEFGAGNAGGYITSMYLTNCLFDRTAIALDSGNAGNAVAVINSTLYGGMFYLTPSMDIPITIENCALDQVQVQWSGDANNASYVTYDYNAYTNSSDPFPVGGTHDVRGISNYNFESSWFGDYYLPTNSLLINAGSTNANYLGLYHFTTQTNQTVEGDSIVDIGYHYVATDQYGNPLDSNGDGIPDYIEDANGDGLTDDGESLWGIPPTVSGWSGNKSADLGDDVNFTVTATGVPALLYQWYFNGSAMAGATNATLALINVLTNSAGTYSVTVANSEGSTNLSATLTVALVSWYNVMEGAYTNFTFQSEQTYYVDSTIQLYGVTTIQSATVIKYGNHPTSQLVLNGSLVTQTGLRPAILTSRDDNTIGNQINCTSGSPAGNYLASYLVDGGGQTNAYQNLRVKYAGIGITATNPASIWDSQFVLGGTAVSGAMTIGLHNVLMAQETNCVATTNAVTAEFLTADQCQTFCPLTYPGAQLTNSILTAVADTNGVNLADSVSLASGGGVYQPVGGGNYYLETNSPYQNAGTTNVSQAVLADIQQKTTQPPLLFTNAVSGTTLVLSSRLLQDTDTPDLGFHYIVADYYASFNVYNSTLLLTNGVTLLFDCGPAIGGIGLGAGSQLVSVGLANQRNYLVYYSWVQEGLAPIMGSFSRQVAIQSAIPIETWHTNMNLNPSINLRFTTLMAGYGNEYIFYDGGGYQLSGLTLWGCEWYFAGSTWESDNNLTNTVYDFQNNLFFNVQMDHEVYGQVISHNNSFIGNNINVSYVYLYDTPQNQQNWTNGDNAFDTCQLYIDGSIGHNAFLNGSDSESGSLPSDIFTNYTWVSSFLGNFYQTPASPMVNAGSTTADQLGLYYYTTQTNQVPETNSIVDIGYHYVALGANGSPLETFNDGIPDYLDDPNGTGLPIWWEMKFFGNDAQTAGALDLNGNTLLFDYENGINPLAFGYEELGHWRFDNTNSWIGDQGQLPLAFTNIIGVPSWDTNAVLIDSNSVACLKYRFIETNGAANIFCNQGTVRFWFKADWSSTNVGGTGPGDYGRLIELGQYAPGSTNGWWSLYFSPDGGQLMFASATNGVITTNITAAVTVVSNEWYNVNFAYTPSLSTLTFNSQQTYGAGITAYPNAAQCAAGFCIGSDWQGLNQAHGTFEDLETFNFYSLADCAANNAIAPPELVPPLNGLVGWWRGESNALDSSGNDLNGVNDGIAQNITYLPGEVGLAFHCNSTAVQAGVNILDNSQFILTNSLSIAAWVRPRANGYNIFWRGDARPGYDPYSLSMQNDNSVWFTIEDVSNNQTHVAATIPFNQWTHVVGLLDDSSGMLEIYTNGILAAETNATIRPLGSLISSESPGVCIGNVNDGHSDFGFNGDIDEVMLYSRALSADEIYGIYSGSADINQNHNCTYTTNGPPILTHVNTLHVPVSNGSYVISYVELMTNSDAYDPQGLPLVFIIDSVASGSLLIDGVPFGVNNNSIGPTNVVTWTPPSTLVAPGTPAFITQVFDGIYESALPVNVVIQQQPLTHLFGWGNNGIPYALGGGNAMTTAYTWVSNGRTYDFDLAVESTNGVSPGTNPIIPYDPRWQLLTTNRLIPQGFPPQPVLDLSNVVSLTAFNDGQVFDSGEVLGPSDRAVTVDGHMYFWGPTSAYSTGRPLVIDNYGDYPIQILAWDASLNNYLTNSWSPLHLLALSPVPVLDSLMQTPITGVSQANQNFVIKSDGSLWSFGSDGLDIFDAGGLGRLPVADDDLYDASGGGYLGMILGRVEIPGNNDSQMIPGRKVVEINTGAANTCGLARCADGTLWTWGSLVATTDFGDNIESIPLAYGPTNWQPVEVTQIESASSSPIVQISAAWNHFVLLRQDSSISEFGYVPGLDPDMEDEQYDFGGEDPAPFYSTSAITVSGTPAGVIQVTAGQDYSALLTQNGNVWVWGHWLGTNVATPQQITSLKNITKICAGDQFIAALDTQGRVWVVGENWDGVFGYNDSDNGQIYTTAQIVSGIENVVNIFIPLDPNGSSPYLLHQIFAVGTPENDRPQALAAEPMNQAVQLNWTNFPGASSYVIYRSLNEMTGYVGVGTSPVNSYLDQDPPLQNGQTYYYEVAAVVTGVSTLPSWDVAATPLPQPTVAQTVTATGGCGSILLAWNPPTNAAQSNPGEYIIERSVTSGGGFVPVAFNPAGSTTFVDTTVGNGQTYYYQVIPANSAGQASGNVTVSATTDPGACALAPTIASNWLAYTWYQVNSPTNWDDVNDHPLLYWTGPSTGSWLLLTNDILQSRSLIISLTNASDPLSSNLWNNFTATDQTNLIANTNPVVLLTILTNELNTALQGPNLYNSNIFNGIRLSAATTNLLAQNPTGADLVELNRRLLQDYYYNVFISGPSWGPDLTGFRIFYHYTLPNGQDSGPEWLDISLSQATASVGNKSGLNPASPNDPTICYGCTWPVISGNQIWASVAAIVDGEAGNPSFEVGPMTSATGTSWQVTPRAIPGYQQVYLDWPDDISICDYGVDCTALIPSYTSIYNNFSSSPNDWVALADPITDSRYWNTGLTATNFTPVDFKDVADLVANLSSTNNLMFVAISNQLSPTAIQALTNFDSSTSDYNAMRGTLTSEFNRLIQADALVFTPSQVGLSNADFSVATLNLLSSNFTTLSISNVAALNRLLIEDAMVHDVARFETPNPVGFVSGDFTDVRDLVKSRFAQGNQAFPPTDDVALKLWNLMLPAVTNEIITNCLDNYTNNLALSRDLAVEFSRIIQTNVVLFSSNDIVGSYGQVSDRTWALLNNETNLTTNQVFLLNRLAIQDAWSSYGSLTYDLEPLSDLRYYWVNAYFCDDVNSTPNPSYWAAARPDDDAPAPAPLAFSAQAFPYDSMVVAQWNVPGTTNYTPGTNVDWQFSLERQEETNGQYSTISDGGFDQTYQDFDVVNGTPYQYRVTACDTNYNRYQALTGFVVPTNSTELTLFTPQAGNGYVNLTWTPLRVNNFIVQRAFSPDGPFTTLANINTSYVYDSSSYSDLAVQNGVTVYYQIIGQTPTGFQIESAVQSATPSALLTPLQPFEFRGKYVPDDAAGQIQLRWNPVNGSQGYQVFLVEPTFMLPLPEYDGVSTLCSYEVPLNAAPGTAFTFAVRAISPKGLPGNLAQTTVTNLLPYYPAPGAAQPVVVQVADWVPASDSDTLQVVGPTNLTVSANISIPYVQQVSFYAEDLDGNSQLIGSVDSPPFQMTWYHVPVGFYSITATALAQSSDGTGFLGGGGATYSSEPANVNVNVVPQLSGYQTSATDLQLPAPALPIALTRSYSSRNTATNNPLGVGWSANWTAGSIVLSTNLAAGWSAVYQPNFGDYFGVAEAVSHYVTVNLPGNSSSVGFYPQLSDTNAGGLFPVDTLPAQGDGITINYASFATNEGSLWSATNEMTLDTPTTNNTDWTGPLAFSGGAFNPGSFTYTGPDGTSYVYGQPLGDGVTWLLTQVVDLASNSLTYTYDTNNNLLSISNSCGRAVNFTYVPTAAGTNIEVFDTIGGSNPALVYVVVSNQLAQVQQLVNRSGAGAYLTNTYVYGNNSSDTNNYERLTQVYDPRNVEMLQNVYSNGDGDLAIQISPGQTNAFKLNDDFGVTVTTTTSTATNTVEVACDSSGAISGATVPASGSSASSTLTTQNTYNSSGLVVAQSDANGNVKTYSYDDENRLVGQSDGNGNSTATQLNQYGQPTLSADANGNQTVYAYDSADNPTSVSVPSGTTTTYTYSAPVTAGSGNVLVGEQQTSESQNVPYVPYIIVTTNTYDTTDTILGDLLQTTEEWVDNGGNVIGQPVTTSYTYDANGNRLTETKTRTVNGGTQTITSAYTYDALNRVVMTIVSATGAQTLTPQTNTVTYNALGKQATSTDAAGRMTTNVYDFNGNAIETDYPDGTVSRTVFDALGHQQYVQDRAVPDGSGNTIAPATYNVYDASGRVIQTGRSDGVELTRTTAVSGTDYNALGSAGTQYKLMVASTGTVLTTNLSFYDAMGNVLYSVDARGAVTQSQYDADYQRTNTLVYTAYTFALNGTNMPTPTGPCQSTIYGYDANGNQVSVTDARGNTTTSVYDSANNVIEVDEPGSSGTVSQFMSYDGLGRKIQSTDEAGVSTGYTYDFRGLLTSVTLAFGTTQAVTTVYQYDEAGNEISQTDANGHTTAFQYDALGHRLGRTLPGGQSEGFAYNLAGDQIYQTNFNNVLITNQYDVDDRLTNCTAIGYQSRYAYNLLGWRTNMADASGQTAFYYNDLGQLTNKTVTWNGGPTVSLKYGYDLPGSITNIQSSTANGVNLVYQYDILGRITNVLANGSSVAQYGFDIVGNLQSLKYGNGVTNLYQYDAMNHLTSQVWNLNASSLASFGYTLGPTGNRTALSETVNGTSRTYNWTYDCLYRLTGENITGMGAVNYAYDSVGNRTNRTSTISQLANTNSTYTANDWLTSDQYDNNGNTTNSAAKFYQYDVMNHVTNVNNGTILVTYDGDGDRISKTVSGVTTYYLVDDINPSGYAQVLEEYQSPSLSRVYNYGLDLISQRTLISVLATNYFITDGHGSTRILADAAGNIVNDFAYDAYGMLIASNSTPQTFYLYCGQQFDSDLGLYYNRARYLNAGTGRFWTMDTHDGDNEEPLSLHRYMYGEANPIDKIDPSGHNALLFGVGIGIATLIVGDLLINHTETGLRFQLALGIGVNKLTDQQQQLADDAEKALQLHGLFSNANSDLADITIYSLAGYGHFGIEGIHHAWTTSEMWINVDLFDPSKMDWLEAAIAAETEHVPKPWGLGMDEEEADIDFHHVVIPAMGWKNTPINNWHHYGQHAQTP